MKILKQFIEMIKRNNEKRGLFTFTGSRFNGRHGSYNYTVRTSEKDLTLDLYKPSNNHTLSTIMYCETCRDDSLRI